MSLWKQRQLLAAGAPVPDFKLPLLDGGEAALAGLASSRPVLLAFFKVSCPVCQMTLPFLDRIYSPERLAIYAVSQNDASDTRDFQRRFKTALPTLLDSEQAGFPVSNAFGISHVPTLFFIEDGAIARVVEGWRKSEMLQFAALAGVSLFRPEDSVPEAKAG
jgi:peroxiredoxin